MVFTYFQFNLCAPIRQGRCNGTTALCEIDGATDKAVSLADSIYSYYNRFNGIVISFVRKDRGNSSLTVLKYKNANPAVCLFFSLRSK